MRDSIRQFGVDCVYFKLNTSGLREFRGVIDRNYQLRRAYGYDEQPVYDVSAQMITLPNIEQDVFQLTQTGLQDDENIELVFDKTDFACALAPKMGQYTEYAVDEREFDIEIPDPARAEGYQFDLPYRCGVLSGDCRCTLGRCFEDCETTIVCDPYEHTDFQFAFPQNADLYRSLEYKIKNDDYLETMLFFTFVTRAVKTAAGTRYVAHGRLHGSVLFFDLVQLGKYMDTIHPDVGDVVMVDFLDDRSREKYEITECVDKQLSQDGINPLLHDYVWKCRARRYIDTFDENGLPKSEADDRVVEQIDLQNEIQEQVAAAASFYPDGEDAAYGGYERQFHDYDRQLVDTGRHRRMDFLDDGTALDILRFGCGSRLVTTGYELLFVNASGEAYQITTADHQLTTRDAEFETGLQYLKASDSRLVFVNIEGQASELCRDERTPKEVEL